MEKRGLTFNDLMMMAVSIPLILSWITFACIVIWAGINDDEGFIQQNLDFYVSLIAIIGLLFLRHGKPRMRQNSIHSLIDLILI